MRRLGWGVGHVGGGSHGSLGRGDSLGPLVFSGCGPDAVDPGEQWALRDGASSSAQHFKMPKRRVALIALALAILGSGASRPPPTTRPHRSTT